MDTENIHLNTENNEQTLFVESTLSNNLSSPIKQTKDYLLIITSILLFVHGLFYFMLSFQVFFANYPKFYLWTELLINYQGGFLKRGLLGEILFQLKSLFDMRLTALFLFFAAYFVYLPFVYKKLRKAYDPYTVLFIFASPGLVLYLFYDLSNITRKDIFTLTSLILQFHFISLYIQNKLNTVKTYSYIFIAFLFAFLIHEIILFFSLLPALLLWNVEYKKGHGKRAFCCIGLILFLFICLTFIFSGTTQHQEAILKSYSSMFTLPNTATTSGIFWVDKGMSYGFETVKNSYTSASLIISVFLSFLFASLPLVSLYYGYFTKKSIKSYFALPYYTFFLSVALLFPFTLFIFVCDFGRIISFTLMYYLFFFLTMQECFPQKQNVLYQKIIAFIKQYRILHLAAFIFILFYASYWRILHISTTSLLKQSVLMDIIKQYL